LLLRDDEVEAFCLALRVQRAMAQVILTMRATTVTAASETVTTMVWPRTGQGSE
jgi:hypothetical protein